MTSQWPSRHLHSTMTISLVTIVISQYFTLTRANFLGNEHGFSLEVIQVNHPSSSFHRSNMTETQLLERGMTVPALSTDWLRHSVVGTRHAQVLILYHVVVQIGSPAITYQLQMDTTSDLAWTQCRPCAQCFQQRAPIFDPRRSASFRNVTCDDPLCRRPWFDCTHNICTYSRSYVDGTITTGRLVRERVWGRGLEAVNGVAIGCSHITQDRGNFPASSAGILGLGNADHSFAWQLSRQFSYCLGPGPDAANYLTFLRFGNDILRRRGESYASTPLIRSNNRMSSSYYLRLVDISINAQRLHINPEIFELRSNGNGGVSIDVRITFSYLIRGAYDRVVRRLFDIFSAENFQRADPPELPGGLHQTLNLCYRRRVGFIRYPSMFLHFDDGANLVLPPENLFVTFEEQGIFCLAFIPSQKKTAIGNHQQRNIRFIFHRDRVEFARADCASHP